MHKKSTLFYAVPSARLDDDTPKDAWSTLKIRSKYYLPILEWLPRYTRQLFMGDCVAGITLACLLIPQGLSYATALCKLDAIHGLYGIAFPAISYAFFGMSRYYPIVIVFEKKWEKKWMVLITLYVLDKCL